MTELKLKVFVCVNTSAESMKLVADAKKNVQKTYDLHDPATIFSFKATLNAAVEAGLPTFDDFKNGVIDSVIKDAEEISKNKQLNREAVPRFSCL